MFLKKTFTGLARDFSAVAHWIACMIGAIRPGPWGEFHARRFLRSQGFVILDTNWRCPIGELDIVALSSRRLHVIEVKTRRIDLPRLFRPIEALDPDKCQTLVRLTEWYRRKHHRRLKRYGVTTCSIDVVLISYSRTRRGRLQLKTLHRIDSAVRREIRGEWRSQQR